MNKLNVDNPETADENITPEESSPIAAINLREEKILELSDRMLEKISFAIDELSLCQSKEKERVKEVEYDEESKKVVRETNFEKEKCEISESLIDTAALKQLVSTLKDIKDIHLGICSSKDVGEDDETGVIVISPVDEIFSDEAGDDE